MKIGTWIAIYFIVWWVVLFVALPFGVRRDGAVATEVAGADPGAPVRPHFMRVMIIATTLAAVLCGALWLAIEYSLL